jgi:predicted transcriptional regulator
MSTIEIARKLKISQPAVSRSSTRGEMIEKEDNLKLIVEKRIKS